MFNFHTNAELVVLLFLYIYCLYDIIRKIIIFIVFFNLFNLKKAADTDLVSTLAPIQAWGNQCTMRKYHKRILILTHYIYRL